MIMNYQKLFMKTLLNYRSITCHGAWLDKSELEKIQEVKINDYKTELNRMTDYAGNAFSMAQSQTKDKLPCM